MMRFDRFTERAQDAAARAYEILQRYGHNQVDTEHILLALLEQPEGVIPQILEKLSVEQEQIKKRLDDVLRASPKAAIYGGGTGQVFVTPRVKRLIDLANEEANRLKDEYISTEHIFLAILSERNTAVARILAEAGITKERVYDAVKDIRGGQRVTDPQAETRYRTLEKYSRDLTAMAKEGKLDPVIGRDNEIMRIIQILSRRTKNNPILIGEAGVGKTAIVEGLALRMLQNDIPESLKEKEKYIEKDPALTRRFQPVYVNEPSEEDAIAILRGLKEKYELYHGVRITDDAIVAAVNLSSRYITDRFLPDKAVDLIDESASHLKISLENKPPVLEDAHRKIMRLEIEKEALKKELSSQGDHKDRQKEKEMKARLKEIDQEVGNLTEKTKELELKWTNEKETVTEIRAIKKELESIRLEAE